MQEHQKKLIKQIVVFVLINLLLFLIAYLSIRNVKVDTQNITTISDVKNIQSSLSYYYYIYNKFPDTTTPEECGNYRGNISGCCFSLELGFSNECGDTTLIRSIPVNVDGGSYSYLANEDNTNYALRYQIKGELKGFRVGVNTASAGVLSN